MNGSFTDNLLIENNFLMFLLIYQTHVRKKKEKEGKKKSVYQHLGATTKCWLTPKTGGHPKAGPLLRET